MVVFTIATHISESRTIMAAEEESLHRNGASIERRSNSIERREYWSSNNNIGGCVTVCVGHATKDFHAPVHRRITNCSYLRNLCS
jgi:hypothetical protein